ncbi:unnamed protein product [Prunus armeniaca]|uniref:Uncharacterized protein n=1 Tax=Prunus armeniaca TaxID=36596 RepID=A0A6J5WP01_PRUAR|nr:unnamed protein product [Prunus armeniaca]CAB4301727.1 unnamed protein product [Prunus armeniaca]
MKMMSAMLQVIAQEDEERRVKRRIPQMTMMVVLQYLAKLSLCGRIDGPDGLVRWVLITGNWHVKPDDNDLFQDVISKLKL